MQFTAERDDLSPRLSDNKVPKENLEWKLSNLAVTSTVLTALGKHMDSKLSSLQNKRCVLAKTIAVQKLKYGEPNTVVGKSERKLVKRVATRCVEMTMSISRAIRESCLRGMSELDYFSQDMHRNWTERSKKVRGVVLPSVVESVWFN